MSSVIVLRDKNPKILESNVRKVIQAYESKGFTVHKENLNAVGAWFGSLPGNAYANVRQPLISTLIYVICYLFLLFGPEKQYANI